MRKFKFRAWDLDSNKWLNVSDVVFSGGYVFKSFRDFEDYIPVVRPVVVQYTGLKDKHGKEIYEGDMVEVISNIPGTEYLEIKGMVVFKECIYCIEDKINEKMINLWNEGVDVEVIGNIYDNPELLEGANQ